MHPFDESVLMETRRQFFGQAARGLGVAALATMLGDRSLLAGRAPTARAIGGLPGLPHFAPKAKRAIYLHMVGAPPQIDLFDYKPKLAEMNAKPMPGVKVTLYSFQSQPVGSTVTDAEGKYAIKGVPAGKYTLKLWHEKLKKPLASEVTVPESGAVAVNF